MGVSADLLCFPFRNFPGRFWYLHLRLQEEKIFVKHCALHYGHFHFLGTFSIFWEHKYFLSLRSWENTWYTWSYYYLKLFILKKINMSNKVPNIVFFCFFYHRYETHPSTLYLSYSLRCWILILKKTLLTVGVINNLYFHLNLKRSYFINVVNTFILRSKVKVQVYREISFFCINILSVEMVNFYNYIHDRKKIPSKEY